MRSCKIITSSRIRVNKKKKSEIFGKKTRLVKVNNEAEAREIIINLTHLFCCILRHFHKFKIIKTIKLTEMEFFISVLTCILYGNWSPLAYNGKDAIFEVDVNTNIREFSFVMLDKLIFLTWCFATIFFPTVFLFVFSFVVSKLDLVN